MFVQMALAGMRCMVVQMALADELDVWTNGISMHVLYGCTNGISRFVVQLYKWH